MIASALLLEGCAHSGTRAPSHPAYKALLEYEGSYESDSGHTLQIAASPRDNVLVALISGAKYPLRPVSPDTFANSQGQHVVFARESGRVAGYTLPDSPRLLRRLSSNVRLPEAMWYPRLPAKRGLAYAYVMPADRNDGLKVGTLKGSGLEPARIEEMIRRILQDRYPDVHSVLIVKNGALVLEEYFYEYDVTVPHALRSATKSIVSALVGLAIEDGFIRGVQEPVLSYFQGDYASIENMTDAKGRITLEHLLTNRSGLACNDWDVKSPGNETQMGKTENWVKFILDLPMLHEPGTEASYCSGGVIILGRIVEKAAGMPIEQYARKRLFEPLGIDTFEWRFDPDRSSEDTFCQLSLRPRDMAKLGLLFLNGGLWNEQQVIPKAWVETSTARHTSLGGTDYGYLWWRPYLTMDGGRHHGILATGNGGQKIFLFSELDMVVVLTGGNYNTSSPANELLINYVLPPV